MTTQHSISTSVLGCDAKIKRLPVLPHAALDRRGPANLISTWVKTKTSVKWCKLTVNDWKHAWLCGAYKCLNITFMLASVSYKTLSHGRRLDKIFLGDHIMPRGCSCFSDLMTDFNILHQLALIGCLCVCVCVKHELITLHHSCGSLVLRINVAQVHLADTNSFLRLVVTLIL